MKHLLVSSGYHILVACLITLGLGASGCRDSVSTSERTVEVPLSSLTITPGALQPAFSRNTTSYFVEVSTKVTTVTVTATPKDSTTTISINRVDYIPGESRSITLSPSEPTTTIAIVLTSQNGIQSTYDVLVRRVDNTLSALSVTPPSTFPAPGFNPSILTYQIDVASGVSNVAVVATKADVHAVMSGSVMAAAGIATGQATIPLKEQGKATVVSITVAGPNGEAKTYTITINRLSGNNTLRELSVIPGTFDRRFDPTVTDYVVTAPTKAEQVTVTATKSDPLSAMSGNVTAGAGIETGTGTFQLGAPGSELPLSITVAAADPTVPPREYRITVKRAVPSNNANLSALTADAGSFDPPIFNPDTKNYEVKVGLLFPGNVTLTATKSDPNATMSALGSVIALPGTPTGHVTVTPGFGIGTPVNIDVRAEDGVNSTTYTITVVRGLF